MKSLNDNFVSTHGSSHETFSDLMFCVLIVLVLFVMALAIEVSQRVRSKVVAEPDPVPVVTEKDLETMTKEEVAELSKKLEKSRLEIQDLEDQLAESQSEVDQQRKEVQNQMAALNGEQRFTGAREPASLTMAYDYLANKFYFISARKCAHAVRQQSGETIFEYSRRKTKELVALALEVREQRGYTLEEAKAIYQGFTAYKEVEPTPTSYRIIDSEVGISYITSLSGYVAGITEMSEAAEAMVTRKLLEVYEEKGEPSTEMYPKATFKIVENGPRIIFNGVSLSPRDAKEILLSLDGRGALLDLEGLSGKPPNWLQEEVLTPAGYISKIPKLPGK